MRSCSRHALAPAIVAILLGVFQPVKPACAQTDSDRATARELAKEGADALEKKDFNLAFDRFSRADALYHAPTLVVGLARAQVGLGKLVAAQENYNRVLREVLPPNPPDAYVEAVNDAKKDLAALSPLMPWVIITIIGPKDLSLVSVKADAEVVPEAALGVRRAIEPGDHVISAEAPGFFPAEQKIQVTQASVQEVKLELKPAPASAVKTPSATPTPGEPWRGFFPQQDRVGLLLLGFGASVLVDGAITGVMALNLHDRLEQGGCNETGCPTGLVNDRDTFRTLATVSTVSFIGGGVAAVAGLVLVFSAPGPQAAAPGPAKKDAKGFFIRPYAGFGSAGVWGSF